MASDEHLAGNRDQVPVLVPCYNEERAVAKVVADFHAALSEAATCVYNNNSTDGTVAAYFALHAPGEERCRG